MIRAADFDLCVYCPRLCRHVCPVAVGSGREATTPTAMMTGPWAWLAGDASASSAAATASLCTGCGACTDHCKLRRPVTDLLAEARGAASRPAQVDSPGQVEGDGDLVAVESDDRCWAEALATLVGRPVARLATHDHLGAALLDHPDAFERHALRLRERIGSRTLVASCHSVQRAAVAAGLSVRHLEELVPPPADARVHHPCKGPHLDGETAPDALACCGAEDPLLTCHPHVAREVGDEAARRLSALEAPVLSPDSRCARHLQAGGAPVHDLVDVLLSSLTEMKR